MSKSIFLLFFVVSIFVLFGYFRFKKSNPAQVPPTNPIYGSLLMNPYAAQIRQGLNGYLDGTNDGMDTPELVINPLEGSATYSSGLKSFDKSYYRSKFVVLSSVDSMAGGQELNILFRDKPDKVFVAWVYHYPGNDYFDLRGFAENPTFTKDWIENFVKTNGDLLQNEQKSI